MSGVEIALGGLVLLGGSSLGDYSIDVCTEGTDYGNPEAVVAEVASMLMDGDRAQITRYGNREATLKVKIKGTTLDAVAAGTAAIETEVNKGRNVLTWLPPNWATASVFDVVYAVLKFDHDDLAELRVERFFTLTLVCLPFARRQAPTVVVAEPIPDGTASHVTLDAGTSLTGWAATIGTMSLTGGLVHCTPANTGISGNGSGITRYYQVQFTRSGLAASVDADEFVVVDIEDPSGAARLSLFSASGMGLKVDIVATQAVAGNRVRWYLSPTVDVTVDKVSIASPAHTTTVSADVVVHEIYVTDQMPFLGTRQQRTFTATVGGTARTQATIAIAATPPESQPPYWSDLLVFTAPAVAAITPPLRPWLTLSSTVTADANMISGAKQTLATPSKYTVPVSPTQAGTYLLVGRVARASGSGATQFAWEFSTDNDYAGSNLDVSGAVSPTLTTAFEFVELGVVDLPTVIADGSGDVVLEVSSTAGSAAVIDELYLFNLDAGVLTWLEDLDQTAQWPAYFEIRSATLDTGRPDWRVGAGPGATVSAAERAKSPGVHEFVPGLMSIFVALPRSDTTTVSVSSYDRFLHHVAPAGS